MIPIIFIHQGDSHYLANTIAQARRSQDGVAPILIGDSCNRHYRGIQWFSYADYFQEASQFASVFQHYNPSPHHYQWILFCFQKWIFLRAFMEREGISKALLIDSDVLVYLPVARLFDVFSGNALTLSEIPGNNLAANGHAALIGNTEILHALSDLIFEMYGPTPLHERIKDFAVTGMKKTPPESITEMSALALLRERYPAQISDTYLPKGGIAIDHSMLCDQGFEMRNGVKHLRWIEGIPHAHYLESGQWISLNPFSHPGLSPKTLPNPF